MKTKHDANMIEHEYSKVQNVVQWRPNVLWFMLDVPVNRDNVYNEDQARWMDDGGH